MPDTDGTPSGAAEREVDPKLLEILVCPLTKAPLSYDRQHAELISEQAGLAYPIRNGVPIMLPDEARQLGETAAGAGVAALKVLSNPSETGAEPKE